MLRKKPHAIVSFRQQNSIMSNTKLNHDLASSGRKSELKSTGVDLNWIQYANNNSTIRVEGGPSQFSEREMM